MGMKISDTQDIKKAKAVPGPGTYDIEAGKFADANMKHEPTYRIGTAPRSGDYNRLKNAK